MRTLFLLTTLLFIIPNMFGQKEYRLNSPDGKLEVTLYIGCLLYTSDAADE